MLLQPSVSSNSQIWDVTLENLGLLLTSLSHNFDVLGTFCGRKYVHLDVFRNTDPTATGMETDVAGLPRGSEKKCGNMKTHFTVNTAAAVCPMAKKQYVGSFFRNSFPSVPMKLNVCE